MHSAEYKNELDLFTVIRFPVHEGDSILGR